MRLASVRAAAASDSELPGPWQPDFESGAAWVELASLPLVASHGEDLEASLLPAWQRRVTRKHELDAGQQVTQTLARLLSTGDQAPLYLGLLPSTCPPAIANVHLCP